MPGFGARVAIGRSAAAYGSRAVSFLKSFGSRVSSAISSIKNFIKCPIPEACPNIEGVQIANLGVTQSSKFDQVPKRQQVVQPQRVVQNRKKQVKLNRASMFGGAGSFATRVY